MRNDELEATLFEAERALLSPQVRHATVRLERLLHEDFVEFGKSGRIFHRADILRELPAEPDDGRRIEATDFRLQRLGIDVALVTYRAQHRNANGIIGNSLRSSLWRKDGDEWRMIFHQGTPVPP